MKLRRRTSAPLWIVCGLMLAGWGIEASGLRLNTSPSVPFGLYRIAGAFAGDEELVAACLPEPEGRLGGERGYLRRGSCPGDVSPVVKHVGARGGDRVRVAQDGIFVNGRYLQAAAPSVDSDHRALQPIAPGDYELRSGELWLYSPHPSSWDSRFFGPVDHTAVLGAVRPIWTRVPAEPHTDSRPARTP